MSTQVLSYQRVSQNFNKIKFIFHLYFDIILDLQKSNERMQRIPSTVQPDFSNVNILLHFLNPCMYIFQLCKNSRNVGTLSFNTVEAGGATFILKYFNVYFVKAKDPRRAWQPTPVFLPGEAHGQRSLVGYSPQGHGTTGVPQEACTKSSGQDEALSLHFHTCISHLFLHCKGTTFSL